MTRLDPARAMEAEFLERGAAAGFDRVEQEADVVAEVVLGQDGADEPVVELDCVVAMNIG